MQGILTEEELGPLLRAEHKPQYILQLLGELILAISANEAQLTMLEQNIVALSDAVGACETLLKTPIPLSYTRHTSRYARSVTVACNCNCITTKTNPEAFM